jgi:hypothetical protein
MKLKIDNELLAEEFFEDVHILGIVAPIKSYQFIWFINRHLGFTFRLNNDIEISMLKKNRQYYFSVFEYLVPGSSLVYYLYHNQHNGEYLLPEFKHLDFIWLIKGEDIAAEEITELQQSIRKISAVQLVNEMTNEKIKNKQFLII